MKKIAFKYSAYRENLQMSAEMNATDSNTMQYIFLISLHRETSIFK